MFDENKLGIKIKEIIDAMSYEDRKQSIYSNNFRYLFEDIFGINILQRDRLVEQVSYITMVGEIIEINRLFISANIRCCTFKGIVLAKQLYDEPYRRGKGDIDLYIGDESIEKAVNLLRMRGYLLKDKERMDNPHHIILY